MRHGKKTQKRKINKGKGIIPVIRATETLFHGLMNR